MVTHLDHQHGCVWTFENHTDQCYPPPNLQALLKLVLMPRVDIMSVQAIVSYTSICVDNIVYGLFLLWSIYCRLYCS